MKIAADFYASSQVVVDYQLLCIYPRGKGEDHLFSIIISIDIVGSMGLSVHPASGRLGVRIPAATDLSRKNSHAPLPKAQQ